MLTYRNGAAHILSIVLVALAIGCGQEVVDVPSVVSTIPANGATNVAITTAISATFSMAMNPATITASSFTVTGPGGAAVAGAVTYTGSVATFTPATNLANGTLYTATITTGAANLGGTPLRANYVWTFSTTTPPPTVTATVPANLATNVLVGQVLSATFSEAMNPATITASTFTLTAPGGAVVTGAVNYSGLIATFAPAAGLAYNTLYTATITTGAASEGGPPLAADYVWTFSTTTPPPAVIATVPTNTATGVLVTQAITATFNEAMNCATLASPATTFTVAGPGTAAVAGIVTCAGSAATFTPATALAVNTIYTATITTGAQDPAGAGLAGPYVWTFRTAPATNPVPPTVISTVPINFATGVPINQAVSATFSVAMDPTTIDSATFTVTGPGGTAVAGVVSYVPAGSVATFTPNATLIPSTLYTAIITTGAADLAETPLAQNYVWTFTTGAAVAIPPTVISTVPANNATGVPFNQAVSATFSEPMNAATINSTTFMLTAPDSTVVPGQVTYAAVGNTLTFTPTANLAPSTSYTGTVTTGVQDLAGDALATNYVWTFTTGAAAAVPPELVSTVPVNATINVPLGQSVSATFSEAMDPLTITTTTFVLTGPGGVTVPATVAYDPIGFIATLTPTLPLIASTTYTATVTTGATDLAGDPLGATGSPNPWTFTTGAAATVPPVVLGPTISLFGGFGSGAGITNQGIYTTVQGYIGTTGASTLITGFHDDSIVSITGVPQCTYTESDQSPGTGLVGAIALASPGTGQIAIYTAPGTSQPTSGCPDEGTSGTPTSTFTIATEAAAEALAAYNTLAGLPGGQDVATCVPCQSPASLASGGGQGQLGGRTLYAGVFTSAAGSYAITPVNGDLTLDAQGNGANAYWVFQMATSLTVGDPVGPGVSNVILTNGALASHVFWQVGGLPGAIINYGGGGTMVGTIISYPGITLSSPGNNTLTTANTVLNGRVVALNASVTMVNTVINLP